MAKQRSKTIRRLDAEKLGQSIRSFCDLGNRFMGTAGERRAADYIADRFRASGVDEIVVEPVEALGYAFEGARVSVPALGKTWSCAGLQSTHSGASEGQGVFVGNPRSSADIDRFEEMHGELDGKVVVLKTHWPFLTAEYICSRGAVGLVAISGAPDGFAHYTAQLLPPPPPPLFPGRPTEAPGVIVDSDTGDQLLASMTARHLDIRVEHSATYARVETGNVVARIDGSTDETVIVGAHYDCQLEGIGAHDNAAGVAALLELASLAAQEPLKRTMVFIALAGEEGGCWGSTDYCRRDPTRLKDTVGMINLDVLGWKVPAARTLLADATMMEFASDIATAAGWEIQTKLVEENFRTSDISPFIAAGVPSCFFWRSAPRHPYYHAAGDTVELLDFDLIAETASVSGHVAFTLANAVEGVEAFVDATR